MLTFLLGVSRKGDITLLHPLNWQIKSKYKNSIKGYSFNSVSFQNLKFSSLTILVNRGWIPKTMRNSPEIQKTNVQDEQEIVGILRLKEKRPPFIPKNRPQQNMWYYRYVKILVQ